MNIVRTKSLTSQLALGFLLVGILALSFRAFLHSPESIPTGDSVWELTMSVNVISDNEYPTVYMAVPFDSVSNRVIGQAFTHPGFDLKRVTQRKNVAAREVVAVARKKGKLSLTGEFRIHISHGKRWQKWLKGSDLMTPDDRMVFLEVPAELKIDDEILRSTLDPLIKKSHSQDLLIENIFNYSNKNILSNKTVDFESVEKTLIQKHADALGKANVMIALCRAGNIPSRLVAGVIVQEMLDADVHYWVEVYLNDKWVPYDPTAGHSGEMPSVYLKLKENNAQLAYQAKGSPLEVTIDMEQIPMPAGLLGKGDRRPLDIFDLSRLPLTTQLLMSSLLLLPLGAFVTVVFRSIIGVRMFGTFTPSLLALSVIHADWVTVVVVVSLVTVIGVGGRSFLPKKVSRAPRLSVVLTIVAIAMVFSISLMEYYNLNPSASIVLLPVIVLANLVDRVYAVTDEKGLAVSIYRLIWTCLVASVCYLIFIIEELRHFLVIYPEVHFFTLALIISCSIYKWKTLTELDIFQWIREPKSDRTIKDSSEKEKAVSSD